MIMVGFDCLHFAIQVLPGLKAGANDKPPWGNQLE
jgi:hypothetical protein